MCGSALSFLDPEKDLNEYVLTMMTTSAISGIFLLTLGVFRLGFVTNILSETVITAFTTGSAFNIAASQLKNFWGVSTNKDSLLAIFFDIFNAKAIAAYNWYAFLVGIGSMLLLYALKQLNSRVFPRVPLPMEVLRFPVPLLSSCFSSS